VNSNADLYSLTLAAREQGDADALQRLDRLYKRLDDAFLKIKKKGVRIPSVWRVSRNLSGEASFP